MRILTLILFIALLLINTINPITVVSASTSLTRVGYRAIASDKVFLNYTWYRSITLQAPAVSRNYIGILSNITLIIAYPGNGRVFFSALPFTELDTQAAARTAAWVASSLAGVEFNKYDYYVVMEAQAPIVGGPSAGALMTIGFLSLMLNVSINPYVTMTGMINPDGTIGPVGGLKEKLEAVARNGYKVFLIPKGQRQYTYPVVYEERFPWGVIRRITYRTIDLVEYGKELNVSVYEVSNILEAFKYFTGKELVLSNISSGNKLVDIVRREVEDLFNNITDTLTNINNLISKIDNPFYRYNVENKYEDLVKVFELGAV